MTFGVFLMAKKGILYRITMGRDDQPDFTPNKLPGTRFAQFWDILKGRFGVLFRVNVLSLIFCLPAIFWTIWVSLLRTGYGNRLPFNGNVGIGYPITNGVQEVSNALNFVLDIQFYSILIPLVMLGFLGFSGIFYVVKQLSWGENIRVLRTFFQGIKKNIIQFLVAGLVSGVALFILMFNIKGYNNLDIYQALRIIGIVVTVLIVLITAFAIIFFTTQAVTYKTSIWRLFKNSYIFSVALLPQNFLILLAAFGPIVLLMLLAAVIPVFSMLGYMFVFFIGFSYVALVFTQYSHYVYDKYINDKIIGATKNKGLYIKNDDEKDSSKQKKHKTNNIYSNPKKSKKVDQVVDDNLTQLPQSFSRQDLQILEQQKELIDKQIDEMQVDNKSNNEKSQIKDD